MRRLLALAGALVVGASPSLAMTAEEKQQHIQLVDALIGSNISLVINEPPYCSKKDRYYGAFIPSKRLVVICQTQKDTFDGLIVQWTSEDLDTLRHEAHHVIQDCMDGSVDGYMKLFFDKDVLASILAKYPASQVRRISNVYAQAGLSPYEIMLELEAFAVASEIDAATIGNAVSKLCK